MIFSNFSFTVAEEEGLVLLTWHRCWGGRFDEFEHRFVVRTHWLNVGPLPGYQGASQNAGAHL